MRKSFNTDQPNAYKRIVYSAELQCLTPWNPVAYSHKCKKKRQRKKKEERVLLWTLFVGKVMCLQIATPLHSLLHMVDWRHWKSEIHPIQRINFRKFYLLHVFQIFITTTMQFLPKTRRRSLTGVRLIHKYGHPITQTVELYTANYKRIIVHYMWRNFLDSLQQIY